MTPLTAMPPPALVLAPSPLVGPASWGTLPDVLRAEGHDVVVVDVTDDDRPPFAQRYVARAAIQVREAVGARPVVLVGHSGAGYLLPLLGAARRALRSRVAAYVFLDAGLPPVRPASRLDLLAAEVAGDDEWLPGFRAELAAGGHYPTWTDGDLAGLVPDLERRRALVASLRPRTEPFFTETLAVAPDWPDAPCGMVRLSESYDQPARVARSRGWPVVSADPAGGHFAPCVVPETVADLVGEVLGRLL
jgi:pimeloyl-ACP methyl ester carboxylesterase